VQENEVRGTVLYTDAENFFAQSPVIREEALFQGINLLRKGQTVIPREIKRLNIRRFSAGEINAADLGPVYLRKDSGYVTISDKDDDEQFTESGFSLLINTPGLYKVKDTTFEVKPCCDNGEGETEGGFFAFLPLVLRPAFKEDCINAGGKKITVQDLLKGEGYTGGAICAVDRLGAAAFIGAGGLPVCREADKEVFYIEVISKTPILEMTTSIYQCCITDKIQKCMLE